MSGDPIYTEMIIEYSRNPSNFGKIENPHIHRHDSNPLCGDSIDLYVNVDGTKITEVKFDGKGCAICMACTSVLTEFDYIMTDELVVDFSVSDSIICESDIVLFSDRNDLKDFLSMLSTSSLRNLASASQSVSRNSNNFVFM